MSSIITEFYRGNISPADRKMVTGSEMARAVSKMAETAEILEQTLSPELRPILDKLTDAQLKVNDLTEETYYVDGFKTGARFILAIQDDSHENLAPVHA